MQRRHFLLSGSATAALAMTGCGGGSGEAASADATNGTASIAAAEAISRAATTSAVAYPFGARLAAYKAGAKPTQTNATMDALLASQYDAWKAARVVSANSVVAGGYAVQFSDTTYMTVSEGMGYGMLLAVLFAGHDANARTLFDGLLAVVRTRYAYAVAQYDPNGKYLMDWRIAANGTSAGSGWNAMDGDLDVAMALLMADKQWGSTGTWNYKQEALNTIAALKSWNMHPDGVTEGLSSSANNRTSDYMVGHFRAFAAATGDSIWTNAIDKAYWLLNYLQTTFSPNAGLMPDFVMNADTATPIPSTGYIGDGNANEGYYWWNACRNPWRLMSDYMLSGDARFASVVSKMITFFQSSSGGNPYNVGTGYALNGTMLTGGNSPAYSGPIMLGACVSSSYQTFLDSMWNWNATHLTTGYYDGEIQLLSMAVASGNWWSSLNTGSSSTSSGTTSGSTSSGSTSSGSTGTTTGGTTVVAASLLVNGNFASGLTGWSNWGNSAVASGALQVGLAAGGVGQDITSKVTAGTKYTLTGSANITTAAEGVFVGVKFLNSAGTELLNQTQLVSATSSTPVSITFTAPTGASSAMVYVWKNANGAMGIVQNLTLVSAGTGTTSGSTSGSTGSGSTTATSVLVNGNFSSGLTGWTNWGNSVVSSGALRVGTAAGGVGQDIATKLTKGGTYKLTGTANITTSAEGVFVGVKLMDSAGNVLINPVQLVTSTSGTQVSLTFVVPQGTASGYVYVWKNANKAYGVVDNLSLVSA